MTKVHVSTHLDLTEASPGSLESNNDGIKFISVLGETAKLSFKLLYVIIERVSKDSPKLLTLYCKDFRMYSILFGSEAECARHTLQINKLCAAAQGTSGTVEPYAFTHAKTSGYSPDGWDALNIDLEWKRLELPNGKWRLSTVNEDFKLCHSYPTKLLVPADVDDEILGFVAAYRRGKRLPVLSYMHPKTKAALVVAAEPLAGDKKRCYEDERMFRSILQASPSPDKDGYIIDLRSSSDSQSAKGKGGGHEHIDSYFSWKLVFADLPKTNSLQGSLTKFVAACRSTEENETFMKRAEASGWLNTVKTTLSTSVVVARILVRECLPVVIHGSSGYDQAAQISSLAQLLMDSHFRTFDGFIQLIEKEWLMMGHPFAARASLTNPADKTKTALFRAPVFILFLDCVWQCLRQFPCAFEFNEQFLLALVEHSQGSEFGTFLFNDERERQAASVKSKTLSLWAFCRIASKMRHFVNIFYKPLAGWIKPSFRPQAIAVWFQCYGRGTPYIKFHDEVHDLLMYLKDKHDTTENEVERLSAEYKALLQQLPPEEAAALDLKSIDEL